MNANLYGFSSGAIRTGFLTPLQHVASPKTNVMRSTNRLRGSSPDWYREVLVQVGFSTLTSGLPAHSGMIANPAKQTDIYEKAVFAAFI
jgi:hypothetical protein